MILHKMLHFVTLSHGRHYALSCPFLKWPWKKQYQDSLSQLNTMHSKSTVWKSAEVFPIRSIWMFSQALLLHCQLQDKAIFSLQNSWHQIENLKIWFYRLLDKITEPYRQALFFCLFFFFKRNYPTTQKLSFLTVSGNMLHPQRSSVHVCVF